MPILLKKRFEASLSSNHIFLFGTEKNTCSMHKMGGSGGGGGVDILVKIDILAKIDIFCQDLGFDFIKTIFLNLIISSMIDDIIPFCSNKV